jgi:hypothetical protein
MLMVILYRAGSTRTWGFQSESGDGLTLGRPKVYGAIPQHLQD